MNKTIHHGRNIKRFREMLGLKQEGLAYLLGEDWNQKKISVLEQKEIIEDPLLEKLAVELKVPAEAIRNFDEEAAIYNIQNNYEGSNPGVTGVNSGTNNYDCTFNPLDKYVEALDDIKKLYERLLQSEREKNEILQKLMDK